jgi:ABC-2 type transport system permease protein
VNANQLRAMLWMRLRILINRLKRTGKLGKTLLGILLVLSVAIAVGLFILAFFWGISEMGSVKSEHILWLWLGLALGFSFFWLIGLMTELQRSDGMSFKNLLHLPISLEWVFLFNYLSSFVSLSILIFLPPMLGLVFASIYLFGVKMIFGLLLVLGFFAMITALTYQLRGWLARLMEDKRRGRNIVMAITFCFVLLVQIPNLINLSVNHGADGRRLELNRLEFEAQQPGQEREAAIEKLGILMAEKQKSKAEIKQMISLGAMIIPIGWLAHGMSASFESRWLPAFFCVFGMFLIAGLSLASSYRATMTAIVHGGGKSGTTKGVKTSAADKSKDGGKDKAPLIERSLPWVSDEVSAISYACLQSLFRAPEAKMMLLSPVIMIGLFSFMLIKNPNLGLMEAYLPAMSLGPIAMSLFSLQQLFQNQFGLDRDGFRAYLLSPVPRDRILLGKNLALAPLALVIGAIALLIMQFVVGLSLQHFLGAFLQLGSAFLILSMIGNQISLLGPMRLKGVGMKASGAKLRTILLQILTFFLVPLSLAPLLLPWLAEFLLGGSSWLSWLPIFLLGHAVAFGLLLVIYRWVLGAQGALLQSREPKILDTLTRD